MPGEKNDRRFVATFSGRTARREEWEGAFEAFSQQVFYFVDALHPACDWLRGLRGMYGHGFARTLRGRDDTRACPKKVLPASEILSRIRSSVS